MKRFIGIGLVLSLGCGMPSAHAFERFYAEQLISKADFVRLVQAHEAQASIPRFELNQFKVGMSPVFVNIRWLRPGQARYSFDLAVEKILKYADDEFDDLEPESSHPKDSKKRIFNPFPRLLKEGRSASELLQYDDGKSLLPKNDAVVVALTDDGLLLEDGHHHKVASLAAGAQTIPVRVIRDLRRMTEHDRLQELWSANAIYPFAVDGQAALPKRFSDLQDDPNRYLASLLTVSARLKGGVVKKVKSREAGGRPVIVKFVPGSLPFQEMRVADLLRREGLVYDASTFGNDVPARLRERARTILSRAQKAGDPALAHTLIIENSTPIERLPLQRWADEWQSQEHELENEPMSNACLRKLFR